MVRLIDDDHVKMRALEVLKNLFLLGEVDRYQAERFAIERVRTELGLKPDLLEGIAIENSKIEAETLPHLPVPLEQERASRANDEDTVRAATSDQLSEHEAGFDRLAKTNIVSDEQPWTRNAESTHHRNKLVGCET